MEWDTNQEYEDAKAKIKEGKDNMEHATYHCADGNAFHETINDRITEFWSIVNSAKQHREQPERAERKGQEEISENRREAVRIMYKLVCWFKNEMFEEEDAEKREAAGFKKQYEEELEKMQFRVSAHRNNIGVLKRCIRETREAVKLLCDRENDVEEWQVAGINAMFGQCIMENIVPYNLPMAINGLLCMHIR